MTGRIEQTGSAPAGRTLGGTLVTASLPCPSTMVIVPAGRPLAKTMKVVPSGTTAAISTTKSWFRKPALRLARTRPLPDAAINTPAGEAVRLIAFAQPPAGCTGGRPPLAASHVRSP